MKTSPYAALKLADFRFFVAARLFVTLAVQIQVVAVGWQMYALTKDPLSLGLVGLSEALPALTISLLAGHIADVFERRLVAIGAVLTMLMGMFFLAVCSTGSFSSPVLISIIYGLVAILGLARGFYAPTIFGIMSDVIPRNLFGNAIAWNSAIWQASAIAGPCLGGFLYVYLGAASTYFFCTGLLLIALASFYFLKHKPTQFVKATGSVLQNIDEGIRFTFKHQIILAAMALDLFAVLFGGATALLPMFTADVFHCGPQILGVLRAAPSIGALFTSVVLTHKPLADNAGVWLLTAVAGFGLCMIAFGLSTNLYLSLFLLAISGALDGISVWLRNTIIQLKTPDNMKGRVSAVNSMFIQCSNEIGGFESGVAAKVMGLVPSVVFGGAMTLLVVLATAIKAPKLRKLHLRSLYEQEQT